MEATGLEIRKWGVIIGHVGERKSVQGVEVASRLRIGGDECGFEAWARLFAASPTVGRGIRSFATRDEATSTLTRSSTPLMCR